MAEVNFLYGFNRSDGINQLIAGWGNDIHRYESGTNSWTGLSQPKSATTRGHATTFLDKAFIVDGELYLRYNGLTFINEVATKRAPLAKYIISPGSFTRIFLGYLQYADKTFASRVWYTDLPKNEDITYGLEYGMDLKQYANSPIVQAKFSYFQTRNLKPGNPFLILSGPNAGEYLISSINSETQITLTESLKSAATNSTYWAGGNWYDVVTNDNDVLTGFGENSGLVLNFKRNSVHRYDGRSLKPIKGIPGTSSQDSVINDKEFTYYFHPETGIWRTNSVTGQLISRPLQDYINGISSSFYNNVVAWKVGETKEILRFFIGNVSNTDVGINVSNCFIDYDTVTDSLTPGSFPESIRVSTPYTENNAINYYVGDSTGNVFQDTTGNSDNSIDIPWFMDTGWHFPAGTKAEIEFIRIVIHSRNGRGMPVKYMLYGTPYDVDKQWRALDDISDNITEIELVNRRDIDTIGKGIRLLIEESSQTKPPLIEKIEVYWKPVALRTH